MADKMTFDPDSSLYHISHFSFTPATELEDAADAWNDVSGSWWEFTRDDDDGNIAISARSFGLFSLILAETITMSSNGVMAYASVEFNTPVDFRDVTISQGWFSYDFESVAVHEIGHVAGIHDHSAASGSVCKHSCQTTLQNEL